jgi:hypothetical protein
MKCREPSNHPNALFHHSLQNTQHCKYLQCRARLRCLLLCQRFIDSCLPGLHRDAFRQFPFRWIYYCGSIKSTGKETGKTHLCGLVWQFLTLHSYTISSLLTEHTALQIFKIGYNDKIQITTMSIFASAHIELFTI